MASSRGLISDIRIHTINFSAKFQWRMNNNVTLLKLIWVVTKLIHGKAIQNS
ncbi:MAG: hypothetical protein ACI9LX_003407 [Paraglaciecola sp.]|jgi:hypothetical protein